MDNRERIETLKTQAKKIKADARKNKLSYKLQKSANEFAASLEFKAKMLEKGIDKIKRTTNPYGFSHDLLEENKG